MNPYVLTLAQATEAPPVVPSGGDGPSIAPATPGVPGTPAAPAAPIAPVTGAAGGQGPSNPPPQSNAFSAFFPLIVIAMIALMLILPARAQKKERKKMEEMIKSLKKGDKVCTVGGLFGTVADLREDEITLKVDENTRIKFTRTAIQRVVEQKAEPATGG